MHKIFVQLLLIATLLAHICLTQLSNAAVVIQYHHISNDTPSITSTSPELFQQHLAYLAENDYAVVSLSELVEYLREGRDLPDKAVAITFDDGYESVYHQAFPILKQYQWPFTVFVNAHPIEQGLQQFVTWEQLREMAQQGATIANHSWSHAYFLRRLKNENKKGWQQRITNEIEKTQQAIQKNIQQHSRLLAYPYGEFDQATKQLVKELGFVAFGQHSGPLNTGTDLQALPRFPFGGTYGNIEDFAIKIESLPIPLLDVSVLSNSDHSALADTILPSDVDKPLLKLTLENDKVAQLMQCYASGQGAVRMEIEGRTVIAQANDPLPTGRSRYNCTAPSPQSGRYYWYSQLFIKKKPNGEWDSSP